MTFLLWKTTITVWSLAAPLWCHSARVSVGICSARSFQKKDKGSLTHCWAPLLSDSCTLSLALMNKTCSFPNLDHAGFRTNRHFKKSKFSDWEVLSVTFLEVSSKAHPVFKVRLCTVLYCEFLSCSASLHIC